MDFKANIETRESVEAKAKAALGFDLSSALDLVNRTDYSSVEQYLDAAAKALNTEPPESGLKQSITNALQRASAKLRPLLTRPCGRMSSLIA